MELIVPLDSQSENPLYEQIYQYIKSEIRQGRLESGGRLPFTRILARNLRLSCSTTQMAYDQLLSEGCMEALPYKGYFVCKTRELVEIRQRGGSSFIESGDTRKNRYRADFSPRGIDLDNFPFSTWREIGRNTLVDDNKEMFAVGDPQGERALRTAIGDYLRFTRGVDCRPERVLISIGSEYLLTFLPQILRNSRKTAMENPTYKQVCGVLKDGGYLVVPTDMNRCGMDVQQFSHSDADVACAIPSHRYPTGVVMPVKRWQELLTWAYSDADRYLIEDDYDSELRYKGKPIPVLQGIDQDDRVIYVGTFSRSITPATRMGLIVLSEHLLEAYRERAGLCPSAVSRIDQSILYQFVTQGYYGRHLDCMRAPCEGKHDALMAGLRELEDRFLIRGEHAGLHMLLTHRQGEAEEGLMARAVELGAKIYGISGCFIQPEKKLFDSTVMLGYVSLSGEEIQNGTKSLSKAWTF